MIDEIQDITRTDLATTRTKASEKQKISQEYNKNYFDRNRKLATKYSVEDYVMVRNFDSHAGVSKKLLPKFNGPYRISKILKNDRYLLQDVEGFQKSRNPYKGVWAADNIRPWFQGTG